MSNLRYGLGGYVPRKQHLPKFGLTLHDLGELLRRAGQAAGFIVESEYQVRPRDGGRVLKIDWVWLNCHSLDPVVAIEIEGPAVPRKSVTADVRRFKLCKAHWSVIALFQVDNNRTHKRRPREGTSLQSRVQSFTGDYPVDVILDRDLMAPSGIEDFQKKALNLNDGLEIPG